MQNGMSCEEKLQYVFGGCLPMDEDAELVGYVCSDRPLSFVQEQFEIQTEMQMIGTQLTKTIKDHIIYSKFCVTVPCEHVLTFRTAA